MDIIYLLHNQSFPGIYRIGGCASDHLENQLQSINENFFGNGEFHIVHVAKCESFDKPLRMLESHLES
jgi:hypothetical protein